jgi:hypothetical protein
MRHRAVDHAFDISALRRNHACRGGSAATSAGARP